MSRSHSHRMKMEHSCIRRWRREAAEQAVRRQKLRRIAGMIGAVLAIGMVLVGSVWLVVALAIPVR